MYERVTKVPFWDFPFWAKCGGNNKTAAKQVRLNFIRRTTRPRYAGTTTTLHIVLSTSKKILAKFSYPKKCRNGKSQTQKNPSIISLT